MEKDSGRYRYEPYPTITKQNNGNTNSLKRDNNLTNKTKCENKRCSCFGRKKSRRRAFITGLCTNLGICSLLFGYTLIGSFIFLAIEGGYNTSLQQHNQRTLAATSLNVPTTTKQQSSQQQQQPTFNNSLTLQQLNNEAREKTVENIWDITVNLNILYRDNWTRLAAQEITRFQDQLIKRITDEMHHQYLTSSTTQEVRALNHNSSLNGRSEYEWTFAKAFLYSLTVLTTIGYGSIAPRTTLGKVVTMVYAILGIPLTLIYLSSVGTLLSSVARGVFSRALCCCLCSNCGYCCYDEKRMAEKERRMKKKRQQLELQQQLALQEPFYVRSNSAYNTSSTTTHNNLHSPVRDNLKESDSLSCMDSESKTSMHGLSILAPILLCLCMMMGYICLGAIALYKLENWNLLDGIYFCFMSLTTIGFGDLVPGSEPFRKNESNSTIWFCSFYIMSGMALTAMCFNVLHEEIVHRLRHQETKSLPKLNSFSQFNDEHGSNTDPFNLTS
ncbi:TWiK family of potassium channels protein 7 [Chrysoperla carnea]|uniref:TWiK family of potassium channels protein 7 n=1 Tax=Chrysoperla carnea TaxID=189513 RepID=UPI001D07E847|nr:TWiK family of potassium channels protein 7 [Chrysoperla carnea]